MRAIAVLVIAVCAAAVSGVPKQPQRIIGGSVTSISEYPYAAALLFSSWGTSYSQWCGGSILTRNTILSAAHCFEGRSPINWRTRVGSTFGNSGGVVHNTQRLVMHPNYNRVTVDSDVGLLVTSTAITYTTSVQPASIAGANYNLADNQQVWAIGWGLTSSPGSGSPDLRHVQIWTINQSVCRQRYATVGDAITDNMLCSGWLDVGGRDQCQGDSGGPLLHNRVVVGVCSWGRGCADAFFPGVNARVSRFSNWIVQNAV